MEEVNGIFYGYEFKWNERKKITFPLTFTKNKTTEGFLNAALLEAFKQ